MDSGRRGGVIYKRSHGRENLPECSYSPSIMSMFDINQEIVPIIRFCDPLFLVMFVLQAERLFVVGSLRWKLAVNGHLVT